MDEEKALLDRASELLHLTEQRTQLETLRNKTLAAAYAIHHFHDLNPADPQFREKYYAGLEQFHEGLDDKGVQEILAAKQADYTRFQDVREKAMMANYTPQEQKLFGETYAATQDIKAAHTAVLADRDYRKEVSDIFASPVLDNSTKMKFFRETVDPATGAKTKTFDLAGAKMAIAEKAGDIGNVNEQYKLLSEQNRHLIEVRNSLLRKSGDDGFTAAIDKMNGGNSDLNDDDKVTVANISKQLRSNVERMNAIAQGQVAPGTSSAPGGNPNSPLIDLFGDVAKGVAPAAPAPASAAPGATPTPAAQPAPAAPVKPVTATTPAAPSTEVANNGISNPPETPAAPIAQQPPAPDATAGTGIQVPGVPPVTPDDQAASV
jgi:hypothetical protein